MNRARRGYLISSRIAARSVIYDFLFAAKGAGRQRIRAGRGGKARRDMARFGKRCALL